MSDDNRDKPLTLSICINFRAGDILPSCAARGSKELADALQAGIAERGLALELKRLHCMGKCHIGPTMRIWPGGPFVMGATESDGPEILDRLEACDWDALAEAFPLPEEDRNLEDYSA